MWSWGGRMGRHVSALAYVDLPGPRASTKYTTSDSFKPTTKAAHATAVTVTPEDTLDCAQRLYVETLVRKQKRPRIAVLNMANPFKPGLDCATETQEETLLKRTDLCKALRRDLYPLRPMIDLVYTTNVTCLRDRSYALLPAQEWFTVDVMTACAHCFNIRPAHLNEDFRQMTLQLIDLMFTAAHEQGATTLVLGAFGCGMFQNPACDIAELFNTALASHKHKFEEIVFAVYDSEWFKEHDVPTNFNVFKELIHG